MPVETNVGAAPSASDRSKALTTARFAKKGEFVSRNIAGETILVPIRGRIGDLDSIYNLSEVAAHIWNQIDGRTTVRQLVDSVCAEFDVTPEVAAADTVELIAGLQHAGLIEPRLDAED